MHTIRQLPVIRKKWGYPYRLWITQEFDDLGWNLVEQSRRQGRIHDVTLFIEDPQGRFALMSKHSYPPGIFRSPSGGVHLHEPFDQGAIREAKEETGLNIQLQSFVLHITLEITHQEDSITWESYIFHATTHQTRLQPVDLKEVREAIWVDPTQMHLMIQKLKNTENGGLIYRANLTEAFLWSLQNPFKLESADIYQIPIYEKIKSKIKSPELLEKTFFFNASIQHLWAGCIGITLHPNFYELSILEIHPSFYGRGLAQALTTYIVDQWNFKQNQFAEKKDLWVFSQYPAYFIPLHFHLPEDLSMTPPFILSEINKKPAHSVALKYTPF